MNRSQWKELSPVKQRIKIAELDRYVLSPEYADCPDPIWIKEKDICHADQLPDYLNDLNVMHELEDGLTREEKLTYANELYKILGAWTARELHYHLAHATAAQKAEAFVLTMTKDEKCKEN